MKHLLFSTSATTSLCEIFLLNNPTPVSYTHLDVYKRQVMITSVSLRSDSLMHSRGRLISHVLPTSVSDFGLESIDSGTRARTPSHIPVLSLSRTWYRLAQGEYRVLHNLRFSDHKGCLCLLYTSRCV